MNALASVLMIFTITPSVLLPRWADYGRDGVGGQDAVTDATDPGRPGRAGRCRGIVGPDAGGLGSATGTTTGDSAPLHVGYGDDVDPFFSKGS
jgi:hypothetical protein